MSPEANVKEAEKLTVTMAPPPAALAMDKKKAGAKRSEAENLIDGHAATIKGGGKLTSEEEARLLRKQGRTGAGAGVVILGFASFMQLFKYGHWNHEEVINGVVVTPATTTVVDAYHKLTESPWFFGLTDRLMAFRIFASLAIFFLLALVIFPGLFGRYWMKLGHLLGSIMTPILFAVMFYGVFTPASIVMKIFGRDALRLAKHDGSYWVTREKQRPHDHFEHLS